MFRRYGSAATTTTRNTTRATMPIEPFAAISNGCERLEFLDLWCRVSRATQATGTFLLEGAAYLRHKTRFHTCSPQDTTKRSRHRGHLEFLQETEKAPWLDHQDTATLSQPNNRNPRGAESGALYLRIIVQRQILLKE